MRLLVFILACLFIAQHAVAQLDATERRFLRESATMSPAALDAMERAADPEALRREIAHILALDNLSVGSRRTVDPVTGESAIHHYLRERIAAAPGVELLGVMKDMSAFPVSLDNLLMKPEQTPATLTAAGQTVEVDPLWPNGPMPSLTPAAGLTGRLVDVGAADWEDLDGLDLRGSICLMNFGGGRNWERLFELGAVAVVVCEDGFVSRDKAERLFTTTPVPFPRFYANRAKAEQLRALAAAGTDAHLRGGQVFENRPLRSVFAYLPPTEPVRYTVQPDDLLARIALQYQTTAADIRERNADVLPPADEAMCSFSLRLPGSGNKQTDYRGDELLRRLAAQFGIKRSALLEANPALLEQVAADNAVAAEAVLSRTDRGDELTVVLRPGLELTIPNVNQSMLIQVAIDSVSVAPDAPHGYKVATNIATALTLMDQLSRDETIRRRGVVFAFLDGESQGGLASRAIAGQVLPLGSGEAAAFSPTLMVVVLLIVTLLGVGLTWLLSARDIEELAERRARKRRMVLVALVPYLALGAAAGALPQVFSAASTRAQISEQATSAWYQEAMSVWTGEAGAAMSDEAGAWFVEEWLFSVIEAARNKVFEQRIALQQLARTMPTDTAEQRDARAAVEARVEELRPLSSMLGELRSETVEMPGKTYVERAALLRERLTADGGAWSAYDLTPEAIRDRLERELDEERQFEAVATANVDVVRRLTDSLHPLDPTSTDPVFAFFLDVSDGSASLGIRNARNTGPHFREAASVIARDTLNLSRHWRNVLDAAQREAGWRESWTLLTPDDEAVHPVVHTQSPAYSEFWVPLNVGVIAVGTMNDALDRLDSPADILDDDSRLDHIAVQVRTLSMLMRLIAERPADAQPPAKLNAQPFGQLVGSVVRFNARSGVNAKEPLPGAYVYYPAQRSTADLGGHNPATYVGTRRGITRIVRLSGAYALPVEHERFSTRSSKRSVHAYRLSPEDAVFEAVVNQGTIGTQKQTPQFQLSDQLVTEKNLIMTAAYPLVFFPGPDPVDYKMIGDSGQTIEVIDAVLDGQPQHFAMDNPVSGYAEQELRANVLYLREGRRVRVRVRAGAGYKMLLVGQVSDEHPKGEGFLVGPTRDLAGHITDRNIAIPRTDTQVARGMLEAAQRLYTVMRDKGVRDQSVMAALDDAARRLDSAEAFAAEHQHRAALGEARQTWGTMVKFYPRLLQLGREAVYSAVFLMIMLLPASFFLERLIVGGKSIVARLAGSVVIFSLLTAYLNLVHPAFRISVSPFIVMVAFAMILMSAIVLLICYQRFDVLMRRAKAGAGEVEGETISLASSLGTAMSLGVSNLRKRPSRTFLTAVTVTVLTFSIITFVSVSGQDAFTSRVLELDREAGNRTVEPYQPKYQGVVFRSFYFVGLSPVFIDALRAEFGSEFELAVRGWYIQTEGGNNADREGINQEGITREGGPGDIVTGVMTFEPSERRISRLHEAVSNHQWFAPGDRTVIILPDTVARNLRITPADLYDGTPEQIEAGEAALKPIDDLPRVFIRSRWWSVIGILDTAEADRYRDVTGKSLAMVDYLKSGITSSVGGSGDLLDESPSYFMSWRELVIVPGQAAVDVGATPRSVAVRFDSPEEASEFYSRALLRLNMPIFGSRVQVDGTPSGEQSAQATVGPVALAAPVTYELLTSRSAVSLAGLAKIIVPVILCVLIVLNTMLGNVEERKGEVNMLGAVGLSPGQISFLLLSESAVFSVLGIVIGLLIGLGFGFVVNLINPTNDPAGFMGGLSLNFASLTSVGLALLSGLVVLVATLAPARKAAALAAPSGMGRWTLPEADDRGVIHFTLPFTLTRGNAIGMTAFFRQFMANHSDPASEAFNCRDIQLALETQPIDRIALSARMWLAPYDLDVAQTMVMAIVPTDDARVFAVRITLGRTSGSEEAWVRTNYRFMDLVRRQFLLWRNLKPAQRKQYIDQGVKLIERAMETPR